MSYFENNIRIQTASDCVRNKSILNVNTSSDICIFNAPQFTMSGASKIPCDSSFSAITSGTSYAYIISETETTKDITFQFTGDTDSFTGTNATFRYQIYKYDNDLGYFHTPASYASNEIPWSGFSGTSILEETIELTTLQPDGEYLIKGNFVHDICTEFASRLGYRYDTSSYVSGSEFGLYNADRDFYMLIFKEASTPIFNSTIVGSTIGAIKQYAVIPSDGQTVFVLGGDVGLDFIITLNGLVLAREDDYSITQFSGGVEPYVIELIAETKSTDILTVIYTSLDDNGTTLKTETIDVTSILSGPTDAQGSSKIYYNTTTSKYEAYVSLTPKNGNDLLVMVNGAMLTIGVDFYQSISNPKRIIFEGTILVGDIIVIAYNAGVSFVDSITQNNPVINWNISYPPQSVNGEFILEVASDDNMSTIVSTAKTDYEVGQMTYGATVTVSGAIGTELYYRVTNNKNYETLCGDIIESTAYSETIPIRIATNSINSY